MQSVGFDSVGVECSTDEFECSRQVFFESGPDFARRKDEPTFGLATGMRISMVNDHIPYSPYVQSVASPAVGYSVEAGSGA